MRGRRVASETRTRVEIAARPLQLARGAIARVRPLAAFASPLVAPVLVMKALVLIFGVVAYQALADAGFGSARDWIRIWNRMDGPHYLSLAQFGYQTEGDPGNFVVFFPGYPWLVRLAAAALGDYLIAAFVVSGVASVAAALLLGALVRGDGGDAELVQRSVWFFLIFPTSYFLHINYTEGLFIALVVGTFLAARRECWALAGVTGALAALTRVNGLVLIPALAVEAYSQYRATRRLRWRWLWIGLIAIGVAVYLGINWRVYGDPFTFMRVQHEHWFRSVTWPWKGIEASLASAGWRQSRDWQIVVAQELFFVGLGLIGTIAAWIWLRPSYAAWMTGNWLLFTSTSFVYSVPRFTLTLFPLFILLAKLGRRPTWSMLITAWSLLFLALFAGLFAWGQWAF